MQRHALDKCTGEKRRICTRRRLVEYAMEVNLHSVFYYINDEYHPLLLLVLLLLHIQLP
jgi:hypothetical protein